MKKWPVFVVLFLALSASALATTLTSCPATLSTPGGFYVLANDVSTSSGNCFNITATNITLDCNGQTISGTGTYTTAKQGVHIAGGVGVVTVKNCVFSDMLMGIFVGSNDNVTILNNQFYNRAVSNDVPIYIDAGFVYGLIRSNLFNHSMNGIQFFYGTGNPSLDIINNTFFNNTYNIYRDTNVVTGRPTVNVNGNQFLNGSIVINGTASPISIWTFWDNIFDAPLYFAYSLYGVNLNLSTVGNVWLDPFGFGFSQFCTDANSDGVCDGAFTAYTGATDYYPLLPEEVTSATGNDPPVYTTVFAGTDEAVQNFVFYVTMNDVEGGQLFQSLLWDSLGSYNNATIVNEDNKFHNPSDVAAVSNVFAAYCNASITLLAAPPGQLFGADGYVRINNTGCVAPSDVTVMPVVVSDIDSNITVSGNVIFQDSSFTLTRSASIGLYSSTGAYEGQLLFDIITSGPKVNITEPNGTVIGLNQNLSSQGTITWVAKISPTTQKTDWKVYNAFGTLLAHTVQNTAAFTDFSKVRFNDYTSDGYTLIDDVNVGASGSISYPAYVYFDTLAPANTTTTATRHSVKKPISGADYGEYEIYLWGTDPEHGLTFHEDPYYGTFSFNANTPKLSDAEIAAAVNDYNAGGSAFVAIPGDLATYWLPQLYDVAGIKSAGSKFLLGLVLIIITTLALAGFGSAVVIFVDALEAVAFCFPQIGLFPVWFVIVEVIIAAGLVAYAMRHSAGGS